MRPGSFTDYPDLGYASASSVVDYISQHRDMLKKGDKVILACSSPTRRHLIMLLGVAVLQHDVVSTIEAVLGCTTS